MNRFQSWYYQQPTALRTIITINVAVWVLTQLLHLWPAGFELLRTHFALHPVFPDLLLQPWQLVTYSFMHAGVWHIAVNMLLLFWVGREFERMHGAQQFWTVYLLTAVSGGLLCLFLSPFVPAIAGGPGIPVLGASASVLGVLMTVAILYPHRQIRLLFFGVMPLLWAVVGFLVIDSLLALSSSGTAVAAHWGGALTGFLYAKGHRGEIDLPAWTDPLFGGGSSHGGGANLQTRIENWFSTGRASDDGTAPRRPATSDGTTNDSSRSKEVDRILDKISEQGYDALNEEERQTLYEASQS